jgi:hypothetical protein
MKAKFVICLLSVLCVMAWQGAADPIYVENPSFEEPGEGKIHGWDLEDGAHYDEDESAAEVPGWEADGNVEDSGVSNEGDQIMELEDGGWYGYVMGDDPPAYQLTDHTIAAGEYFTLTFDAYECYDGPEIKGSLYYDDNGTRVLVASTIVADLSQSEVAYGTVVFAAYDAPDCIGKRLGIEFDNPLFDDDFKWGTWSAMDDVKLDVSLSYANDIYPPDGAENIFPDVILEWFLEEGHSGDVYFGTMDDPNLTLFLEDTFDTTYDPEGLLELGTTYRWRIDTVDPNEGGNPVDLPGLTWSFTTIGEGVVILTEPQSKVVSAGDTAEFSVEAISVTGIVYQWYKVDKGGGGDIPIPGATGEVLTIEDVQLEDEGHYYCITTNDTGVPMVSAQARLMTKRLVGWWKLDGDLADSVELDVSGAPVHNGLATGGTPDYVSGVDGSAIEFLADGRVIAIRESGDYFNFYPHGMTVSVWVKTDTNQDGVMAKQLIPDEGKSVGWYIGVESGDGGFFTIHPNDELYGSNDTGNIFDGEWHLITAAMDPATQTSRIYVDGIIRGESDPFDFSALEMNEEPVVIGAENEGGINAFHGQVDDVRIWNYPREELDIAWMYLNIEEDKDVCFYQDDTWLRFDYAGEPGGPSYCRIDIEDVVEFAAAWLECHLVPTCVE